MADIDDRMRALRAKFIAQTLDSLPSIEMSATSRDWPSLVGAAHSLAGRAGMFGFRDLGEAARDLEEAIETGAEDDALDKLSSKLLEAIRLLHQDF